MTNPFHNGTIHQQDIRDRNIARQRIAEAIARETRRTEILLNLAVEAIRNHPDDLYSVTQLWNIIQRDETLHGIHIQADQNAADYTGFLPWLNGTRKRLEESGKKRLREAVLKPNHQYRYRNYVSSKALLPA